jgi:hypothetical protein
MTTGEWFVHINEKIYGPYKHTDSLIISEDGKRYGWVFIEDKELVGDEEINKYYVNINGNKYGPYLGSIGSDLKIIFLPQNNFAIIQQKPDENYYYVYINNNKYGPYLNMPFKDIIYTPDGTKIGWVFISKDDLKYYVQINENTYGPYENIQKFILTPAGYIILEEINKKGIDVLHINDTKYESIWHISDIKTSVDGKAIAWKLRSGDFVYIQTSETRLGPFWGLDFIFNPDNKLLITYVNNNELVIGDFSYIKNLFRYVEVKIPQMWANKEVIEVGLFNEGQNSYLIVRDKNNSEYYLQIDEKVYGPYKLLKEIQFSERFYAYGFRFKKEDSWYIQINDSTYGPYTLADNLRLSRDGKKYGWIFSKGDKEYYVQINNNIYGPYEFANDLIISKDGQKVGWSFKIGNKTYFKINNKEYGPYGLISSLEELEGIKKFVWRWQDIKTKNFYLSIEDGLTYGPYDYIWDFSFSQNGNKLGIVLYREKKKYVKINDKEYGPYEDINRIKLSKNGSVFAYTFSEKNGILM